LTYDKAKIADSTSSKDVVGDNEIDSEFFRGLESKKILLNERQVQAVRHVKKPALIISSAGSGKTSVLTSRASRLITVEKVSPDKLLLFTFTRKAADEMKERLGKLPLMTKAIASKVTAGTFHSVFLSILREYGNEREIWSSTKSREITIKMIMKKLGIDKKYEPEVILSQIANYKNKLTFPRDAPQETKQQQEFISIWREYESHKKTNNLIDFDDMLILAYKLFLDNPDVLENIRDRFDYILIDEFQDTNKAQLTLARMIAFPKNNIFAVADDWQVIYSFNGARSEHVLDFAKMYPNATIIPLEINYRSTDYIVGLGNSVIADNVNQMKKTVYSVKPTDNEPLFFQPETAEHEAHHVANEIENLIKCGESKYKDIAILYRNNSNSRAIFDELLIREIPFTIFGNEDVFYETPFIKPMIAYLKLAIDPKNSKALEAVLPTLYLGKDKMKFIGGEQLKKPIANPIEHVIKSDLKPYQASKVKEKISMIKHIADYKPIVAIKTIREDYERYLIGDENEEDEKTLYKEVIKETIDELESACSRFESIKQFTDFIDRVIKNNKIQKEMQKNPNADSVKLMTIHRSKGLEFERVYILHVSEGIIPSTNALENRGDVLVDDDTYNGLEEERRIMYVGITRAKQFLTISSIQLHRNKPVLPSRFIEKYIS
jgi:DNA helicase-2/ATP-dependent DNA helicase PcrA